MKNLFIVVLLLLSCNANAKWDFSYVPVKDKAVGIVYFTSAVGTQQDVKIKKSYTSLRFICSFKSADSIIAINWAGISLNNTIPVSTFVDNKLINESEWNVDEFLVYKNLDEADNILKYFKNGKIVEFKWESEQVKYTTAFILTGIDLGSFNSKCKLGNK